MGGGRRGEGTQLSMPQTGAVLCPSRSVIQAQKAVTQQNPPAHNKARGHTGGGTPPTCAKGAVDEQRQLHNDLGAVQVPEHLQGKDTIG